MSSQRCVESIVGDQRFKCMCVCVYVLMGVSVITWPTGHETEKQTQDL